MESNGFDSKNILNMAFDTDSETGAYIIDVDLDDYSDIFNEWVPPFKRIDLDP